jgi:hypothetical protein
LQFGVRNGMNEFCILCHIGNPLVYLSFWLDLTPLHDSHIILQIVKHSGWLSHAELSNVATFYYIVSKIFFLMLAMLVILRLGRLWGRRPGLHSEMLLKIKLDRAGYMAQVINLRPWVQTSVLPPPRKKKKIHLNK